MTLFWGAGWRRAGEKAPSRGASPLPPGCRPAAELPPDVRAPAGETVEPPPPPQLHFMYVAVAAFVLLFFVGCGVLLSRKRRRQHGQLWFPEGFKVSEASKKKRREPLGEDSVGLKLVDAPRLLGAWGRRGAPLPNHGPRLAWSTASGEPHSSHLPPPCP